MYVPPDIVTLLIIGPLSAVIGAITGAYGEAIRNRLNAPKLLIEGIKEQGSPEIYKIHVKNIGEKTVNNLRIFFSYRVNKLQDLRTEIKAKEYTEKIEKRLLDPEEEFYTEMIRLEAPRYLKNGLFLMEKEKDIFDVYGIDIRVRIYATDASFKVFEDDIRLKDKVGSIEKTMFL